MNQVRYAIIGAGMMGQEHIRNIALISGTAVTVVCDPDDGMREAAAKLAADLATPESPAINTISAVDEINLADVADCLVIVSPNHTHVSVLKSLMPLTLPVLLEKPACTNAEDLRFLADLAADCPVPLWIAMEYRYMPPTARFIETVAAGSIGRLQMLSIQEHRYPFLEKVGDWNRFSENTGGTMVEKCCHYFDLMCLLTGANPVQVYASGGVDVNHIDERYDGRAPDIIDNAFAIVEFDNGMRAMLDLCMFAEGADPQETITGVGHKGKLEVRLPGPQRVWEGVEQQEAEIVHMDRVKRPPTHEPVPVDEALLTAGDHHGATYFQHLKFKAVVEGTGAIEVSLRDGVRAVAMGLAAEESIKTGKAVAITSLN